MHFCDIFFKSVAAWFQNDEIFAFLSSNKYAVYLMAAACLTPYRWYPHVDHSGTLHCELWISAACCEHPVPLSQEEIDALRAVAPRLPNIPSQDGRCTTMEAYEGTMKTPERQTILSKERTILIELIQRTHGEECCWRSRDTSRAMLSNDLLSALQSYIVRFHCAALRVKKTSENSFDRKALPRGITADDVSHEALAIYHKLFRSSHQGDDELGALQFVESSMNLNSIQKFVSPLLQASQDWGDELGLSQSDFTAPSTYFGVLVSHVLALQGFELREKPTVEAKSRGIARTRAEEEVLCGHHLCCRYCGGCPRVSVSLQANENNQQEDNTAEIVNDIQSNVKRTDDASQREGQSNAMCTESILKDTNGVSDSQRRNDDAESPSHTKYELHSVSSPTDNAHSACCPWYSLFLVPVLQEVMGSPVSYVEGTYEFHRGEKNDAIESDNRKCVSGRGECSTLSFRFSLKEVAFLLSSWKLRNFIDGHFSSSISPQEEFPALETLQRGLSTISFWNYLHSSSVQESINEFLSALPPASGLDTDPSERRFPPVLDSVEQVADIICEVISMEGVLQGSNPPSPADGDSLLLQEEEECLDIVGKAPVGEVDWEHRFDAAWTKLEQLYTAEWNCPLRESCASSFFVSTLSGLSPGIEACVAGLKRPREERDASEYSTEQFAIKLEKWTQKYRETHYAAAQRPISRPTVPVNTERVVMPSGGSSSPATRSSGVTAESSVPDVSAPRKTFRSSPAPLEGRKRVAPAPTPTVPRQHPAKGPPSLHSRGVLSRSAPVLPSSDSFSGTSVLGSPPPIAREGRGGTHVSSTPPFRGAPTNRRGGVASPNATMGSVSDFHVGSPVSRGGTSGGRGGGRGQKMASHRGGGGQGSWRGRGGS